MLTDFELFYQLGEGAYATVRLARHKLTGELYAMKIVQNSEAEKSEEFKLHSQLIHPNITRCHFAIQKAKETYFFIQPVCIGDLSRTVVERKIRSEVIISKYIQQIIHALIYCHGQGVTHRDLKPENMLLYQNDQVFLCDFGLAFNTTTSQGIYATPSYMAPEMITGAVHDFRVDLWSLGIVTYELLEGKVPFDEYEEIFEPHKMKFHNSALSDAAKDFIRGLVQARPEHRRSLHDCLRHTFIAGERASLSNEIESDSDDDEETIHEPVFHIE